MANLWLTGAGEPTLGTGEQGDYYRDTVTNLVYFRENPTTWAEVPAFTPSPDGVGTTWLYGTGAPLNGLGSNGNYYFDNDVNTVYFKVLGAWEAKGSLDFIGVYGVQWGNGTGAPANTQPLNDLPAGSFYLDVATSDIYYKDNTLTWSLKGQLAGGGGGGGSTKGSGAGPSDRFGGTGTPTTIAVDGTTVIVSAGGGTGAGNGYYEYVTGPAGKPGVNTINRDYARYLTIINNNRAFMPTEISDTFGKGSVAVDVFYPNQGAGNVGGDGALCDGIFYNTGNTIITLTITIGVGGAHVHSSGLPGTNGYAIIYT